MITPLYAILLGAAGLVSGLPAVDRRTVTSLNEAAFQQAQQRDNTATRAFSAVQIHTGTGECLFVDELSGDFRANLTPIQVAACNSSTGQQWDVITSGKHNNVPGAMLVVSSLTQACMNFDGRRAAGNQVLLFSCGGRGDGSGQVTNSQLFPFAGKAGPLALTPENDSGNCFTVKGSVIDIAPCNAADPKQQFTFGGSGTTDVAASSTVAATEESSQAAVACGSAPEDSTTSEAAETTSADANTADATTADVTTADATTADATTAAATTAAAETTAAATTSSVAATTTAAAVTTTAAAAAETGNPTSPVAVSRAGGVLQPSSAAEANPFDATATRAFTGVQVKSADGLCLFIDPTAGDFRENLIPITLKACDGSANEKFDFITAGKHNNVANSTLVVSSITNGCLNFDNRRAAGDTVIMFSCGGRADGGGQVTNSQLFTFTAGEKSLRLEPENGNGQVCLVPNSSGRLDQAPCSNDAGQLFTIG